MAISTGRKMRVPAVFPANPAGGMFGEAGPSHGRPLFPYPDPQQQARDSSEHNRRERERPVPGSAPKRTRDFWPGTCLCQAANPTRSGKSFAIPPKSSTSAGETPAASTARSSSLGDREAQVTSKGRRPHGRGPRPGRGRRSRSCQRAGRRNRAIPRTCESPFAHLRGVDFSSLAEPGDPIVKAMGAIRRPGTRRA
jgi:hypothetical protein